MQQAVLEHYFDTQVHSRFINRRETHFSKRFEDKLKQEIQSLSGFVLTKNEKSYLKNNYSFLKPQYLEYLANYRYNPDELDIRVENGKLEIDIRGSWHSQILWEVPLMALISEIYFEENYGKTWNYDGQLDKIKFKSEKLLNAGCIFADFGTRRRRSFHTQDLVVKELKNNPNFVGTSNVHLAHIYNLKAIGTQAHEWIMGVSVLESLLHANRYGMTKWEQTYGAQLGTVLPDTFGVDAFFNDFNLHFASLFDSIRHDSGDPFKFADKVIAHYKHLRIDPMSKTIIFSDGLDVDLAIKLNEYCKGKIKCAFGIGTNFTNDFQDKALNMVIKLFKVNGIPVVKISDEPTKATGDVDALKVALWTFFGKPINE